MSSSESPAPRRRLSREDRLRQLLDVAREVSRYREQPLRVSTAAVGNLRLTSVFNSSDTDALLKALPHILPVALRTLPDGSQEIISR